jgi:hypothetical protein
MPHSNLVEQTEMEWASFWTMHMAPDDHFSHLCRHFDPTIGDKRKVLFCAGGRDATLGSSHQRTDSEPSMKNLILPSFSWSESQSCFQVLDVTSQCPLQTSKHHIKAVSNRPTVALYLILYYQLVAPCREEHSLTTNYTLR